MKVTGIYFSPTETTRKCMEMVAAGMDAKLLKVNLTLPEENPAQTPESWGDAVIIAAPVYGGRLPDLFVKRFSALDGKNTPAILLCNYGNRHYDDAVLEMADLAKKAGFLPFAAAASVSQHSFSWKIATGRPNEEDGKKLSDFGKLAAEKLARGETNCPELPGNRPYKEFKFTPIVPRSSDGCLRCLHCARSCPSGAIDLRDPERVDEGKCISCHACVRNCPIMVRRPPEGFAAAQKNMEAAFGSPKREPEWWL